MVAIFVGDDVVASPRGEAFSPSRANRVEHRHAIFNKRHVLRGERKFEAELIGRGSAAKKDLGATPISSLRCKVKREHLIASGGAVSISASVEQRPHIFRLIESSREH